MKKQSHKGREITKRKTEQMTRSDVLIIHILMSPPLHLFLEGKGRKYVIMTGTRLGTLGEWTWLKKHR